MRRPGLDSEPRGATALLLAAGLGTRLRPLTESVPKCLVPIRGRPLLAYWFDRLRDAGIRDVLINTHHLADQVRAFIGEVNGRGFLRVREAHEPVLLGSAGTIRANPGLADEAGACLIVYADNLSDVDLGELLAFHRTHDDPLTMMLFHAPDPAQCGIVELEDGDRVRGFIEKPDAPASDLANGGVYVASAEAYREIAAMDTSDLGHEVLPAFVGRMRGWLWPGYHRDIGTPEALRAAERDAANLFGERSGVGR